MCVCVCVSEIERERIGTEATRERGVRERHTERERQRERGRERGRVATSKQVCVGERDRLRERATDIKNIYI